MELLKVNQDYIEKIPEITEVNQDLQNLSTRLNTRVSQKTALFNITIKRHLKNSCGCEIKLVNFLRNLCGVIAQLIKEDTSRSPLINNFYDTFKKQRKNHSTKEMKAKLANHEIYEYVIELFSLAPRVAFKKLSLQINENDDFLEKDFKILKCFIDGYLNLAEMVCYSMIT